MRLRFNIDSDSEKERRAIEARRAYQKKWRAAHKDRVREYNRQFWLKKGVQNASERKQ